MGGGGIVPLSPSGTESRSSCARSPSSPSSSAAASLPIPVIPGNDAIRQLTDLRGSPKVTRGTGVISISCPGTRDSPRLALARDQDLVVVLPTGGGKSLLFQLPCQVEAGHTTVLVVPLKVLVYQFGHAATLPFSAQVFEPSRPPISPPQLLVVSVEMTQNRELTHYLR